MLQIGKEMVVRDSQGKSWKFARQDLAITRAFRDWIKSVEPDPMGIGEKFFNMLPEDEQIARVKAAEELRSQLACFTLKGPLARRYLETEEGMAEFSRLLLSKHQPDITADQAFSVMMDLVESGQLEKVLKTTEGEMPATGGAAASPA